MLNPLNFLSKIIRSSNQKELDKLNHIVKKINDLEEETKKLENDSFPLRPKVISISMMKMNSVQESNFHHGNENEFPPAKVISISVMKMSLGCMEMTFGPMEMTFRL